MKRNGERDELVRRIHEAGISICATFVFGLNMNGGKSSDALQPLVFALLAGLIPPDIKTVPYDDRIEEIPVDEPTDLVAMTVKTFSARRAYHLALQYRQRGVPVVMGGFHPTLLPHEAGQHATTVVSRFC